MEKQTVHISFNDEVCRYKKTPIFEASELQAAKDLLAKQGGTLYITASLHELQEFEEGDVIKSPKQAFVLLEEGLPSVLELAQPIQ